ncbi:uncharacterized protein LOC134684939 [Mytilus trossulus]|uniref:uncharacterized protein LOC134684939 n=1 Tax=Mytilus trossulus TaxID=6551 RepID=UPI0030060852
MSLTQWLKTGSVKTRTPVTPGLPDPAECISTQDALIVQTANDAVDTVVSAPSRKRKRGDYINYDEETRAKIARYAVDNGVARASRKFTSDLGRKVSETTIRSMRDTYVKLKKKVGTELATLPHSPRVNPLLLGDLDTKVQDWIRKVRINGGVINARIVMAAAEAIVTKFAHHRLERYGGHITITNTFATSLLRRMRIVKRKGTKAVKHLPNDFDDIRQEYISKINNVREKHNIPDTLIINWEQTGCQLVPGGDWTMEKKGTQQISISGLDDKRQITLLLAVSMSGDLLPPQLIYPGKTDRCLPKGVDFPSTWDVICTETHWSNEDTMMQFVNKVIVPYVDEIRDSMPLNNSTTQKAIAIFDVFKAHRGERLLNLLKDNDIVPLFVPACTDRLQPLDLSVNREYKEQLKSYFHDWYSAEVIHQINEQEDSTGEIAPDNVVVNMRTSVLKPIHANLIVSSHNKMSTRKDLIQLGFRKAGLL